MPEMDGFEAMRRITDEQGINRPRFVAHSASVIGAEVQRAMEAGADELLPKPATPDAVMGALQRVLAA